MTAFKTLPNISLNLHSFTDIIDNKAIFVDKTEDLYLLASHKIPMILIRPHDFGKTTLITCLKELYMHGTEPFVDSNGVVHKSYFKDLTLEKMWTDKTSYTVIHLDFSKSTCPQDKVDEFLKKYKNLWFSSHKLARACLAFDFDTTSMLKECVQNFIQGTDIKFGPASFTYLLNCFLNTQQEREPVLLIDNYDYYLNHIPNDLSPTEQNQYKAHITECLHSIFAFLKAYSSNFRKIFVTGRTMYKAVFEHSNLSDITFDEAYASLTGFSLTEIKTYFARYLESALQKLDDSCVESTLRPYNALVRAKSPLASAIDTATDDAQEKLLDNMRLWYGGYFFAESHRTESFSCTSVLRFLHQNIPVFKSFYFDNTDLAAELVACVKKLKSKLAHEDAKDCIVYSDMLDLYYRIETEDKDGTAFLYDMGCLTLVEALDGGPERVKLKIPNLEIKTALDKILLKEH